MRFLPREEKFFALFLSQAKLISEASLVLLEGAQNGNAKLEAASAKLVRLEQEGDEIIHDVFTKLNQTFITPIDPEDIHSVASHMDDVLDGIEEASHRMVAYRLTEIPSTMVELCKIIHVCAEALLQAFQALEADKPLLEQCIEINRQEDIADQLVRRAVADLFDSEKDPIRLIKLKEVYECLEDTTDRCEDVADVLQNVVVKNS
jgi:predicted phosphate transport protein (TIGR00153 family)